MSQMPTISREGMTWIVRLGGAGRVQEYHCATEAQALRMVKLFGGDAKGRPAPQARPAVGGRLALAG